jgi:HSP20 family molecular chaperone IbpA
MGDQSSKELVRSPQILKSLVGDPFYERLQEINDMIAGRAYELYEADGFMDGRDHDHWVQAKSQILCNMPVDIAETETEFTVRAEVPGFGENDLEVEVGPYSLCIAGKRQETSEQQKGKTLYSERQACQVFRVLELPARVDSDQVRATLRDGMLEVTLAKAEVAKKVPVLARAASA